MEKMKKIFSFLLLCMLLFAPIPALAGEAISNAVQIFTLTVTLLDMETPEDNAPLLTVKLSEEETSVLKAAGYCRFLDNRKRVLSPSDFAKRYMEKEVTIDFVEHGPDLYSVIECRGGRQ